MTLSVLATIPLVSDRVEPVVPRARHYASLLPLGAVMVAEGLVRLQGLLQHRVRVTRLAHLSLACAVLAIGAESVRSLDAYTTERLSRPDKNNMAYLATLGLIRERLRPDQKVYLDSRLADALTMSGGRMLAHLLFAFELAGQDSDIIDVGRASLPTGRGGVVWRYLILNTETIALAEQRFRLEALDGGPGEDAPFRVFKARALP